MERQALSDSLLRMVLILVSARFNRQCCYCFREKISIARLSRSWMSLASNLSRDSLRRIFQNTDNSNGDVYTFQTDVEPIILRVFDSNEAQMDGRLFWLVFFMQFPKFFKVREKKSEIIQILDIVLTAIYTVGQNAPIILNVSPHPQ